MQGRERLFFPGIEDGTSDDDASRVENVEHFYTSVIAFSVWPTWRHLILAFDLLANPALPGTPHACIPEPEKERKTLAGCPRA